jgi:hypothetical protein
MRRRAAFVVASHDSSTAALGHGADHASLGAERFASTLAWSYWTGLANSLKPASAKTGPRRWRRPVFGRCSSGSWAVRNPAPPVITAG